MFIYKDRLVDVVINNVGHEAHHIGFMIGGRVVLSYNLKGNNSETNNPLLPGSTLEHMVQCVRDMKVPGCVEIVGSKAEALAILDTADPDQAATVLEIINLLKEENASEPCVQQIGFNEAVAMGMIMVCEAVDEKYYHPDYSHLGPAFTTLILTYGQSNTD
jgi:hypothetical protein